MMKHFMNAIATLLIVSWGLSAGAQNLVNIGLSPVRGPVHVLYEMRSGNIGVLHGSDGFLIIDSQYETHYQRIMDRLEEVGEGKVVYALNTHFHFDHADGNKAFGPKGTTIVAHKNTRARLMADQLIEIPELNVTEQERYPKGAWPNVTFSDSMQLHFNGETISLIHVRNAHTDTDMIVKLENANVIHTGDVFVRYGVPFVDEKNGGSVLGMIKAQETILSLCDDQTIVIPGHGLVCKPDEVQDLKAKLEKIVETVRSEHALKKGGELDPSIVTETLSGGFIKPGPFLKQIQRELGFLSDSIK